MKFTERPTNLTSFYFVAEKCYFSRFATQFVHFAKDQTGLNQKKNRIQPQDLFHKQELKCPRADITMLTLWCVVMGDHVNMYLLIAVLDPPPRWYICVWWRRGGGDDHVTRPSEQIHSVRRHLADPNLCIWKHLYCLDWLRLCHFYNCCMCVCVCDTCSFTRFHSISQTLAGISDTIY